MDLFPYRELKWLTAYSLGSQSGSICLSGMAQAVYALEEV